MLAIRALHKSYGGVQALAGVDLDIAPGEIVGLLGPNGAGKTSLVSIVAGLRRPDSGTVEVGGIDAVARPHDARALMGLAPQEIGIYLSVTVRENLVFFGELHGLRRRRLHDRIDEVAAALGLTELLTRKAVELSGGEKRRLHTAMSLLHEPPLLLLDEPTAGADVRTRHDLLVLVRRLADDGAAICYSTHYLPEVETLGANVTLLENGRVIASGSLQELIDAHGHAAVELAFDGPPPHIHIEAHVEHDGNLLRVRSDRPAEAAAAVLQSLGTDAVRLRSVEIVHPSLESVYLALTGRRYDGDQEREEVDVVPA
jgi:ABC-2 type transport system ATP-binding protein